MELRAGYKQTEVGVIPEDWRVSDLQGVCAEAITYGIVQCGPHFQNGVPYIRVSDMSSEQLDVAGMLRTSPSIAAQFSRSRVTEGDIVYALRGKIGEVRRVSSDVAGANLTQGTARLSPSNRLDSTYLLWSLRSQHALRQGDLAAKGSTFREITLAALRQIQLPVPPIAEQRAIAIALSDVDALLAKIDQLISKKRDLKQAAMQQLLTGQTRLPGFSGEWEVKRLADIAQISPGINKPVSEMGSGVLYVTVQDLYSGNSVNIERLGRIRLSAQETTLYALQPGDIIFGKSSVKRDGIAYPSIFRGAPEPAACTGFAYRARVLPDVADANFVFYALRWEPTRRWLVEHSQASALTNINKAISDAIPISLPALPEQTAIATVLSDMDAELAAMEARRDKTRALKQCMMQVLLTGRIRLVGEN